MTIDWPTVTGLKMPIGTMPKNFQYTMRDCMWKPTTIKTGLFQ